MLNIAIIGTGGISRFHIEGYLAFPNRCRIIALCDILPEKCEETKNKFPALVDAEIFPAHEQMLEKLGTKIDLVSICTPPFVHAELSIHCLEAGINVLVEKPMSASLEECDAMMKAEKESGKILACIAQNRFRDPIAGLKKTLESQLAGPVLHAKVDSFWWRGLHYYDLWWRGKWETEGGGCTLNHAVHHIDMLIWMLGLPAEVVAMLSNAAHSNAEVEDISIAALKYRKNAVCAEGALAEITSSVIHHGEEQALVFQCEKARISAPWKVHASIAGSNAFPLAEHDTGLEDRLNNFVNDIPAMPYTAHTGEIADVLGSLENGCKPAIGSQDGRNTIELISAIYKAGSTGTTVKLPLEKNDPFYTAKGILASMPHFYEKSVEARELGGDITTGGNYK